MNIRTDNVWAVAARRDWPIVPGVRREIDCGFDREIPKEYRERFRDFFAWAEANFFFPVTLWIDLKRRQNTGTDAVMRWTPLSAMEGRPFVYCGSARCAQEAIGAETTAQPTSWERREGQAPPLRCRCRGDNSSVPTGQLPLHRGALAGVSPFLPQHGEGGIRVSG